MRVVEVEREGVMMEAPEQGETLLIGLCGGSSSEC